MRFTKYFFIAQIMLLFFVDSLFSQFSHEINDSCLVNHSTHIVVGEVKHMECVWFPLGNSSIICTKVFIDPEIILKGKLEENEMIVYTAVGEIDGTRMELVGAPKYEIGEKVFVFCELNDGVLTNHGMDLGKKTIKDGFIVKDNISFEDYLEKIKNLLKAMVTKTEGTPMAYNLSQNYPNPFNPTTTIQFSIPKDDFVKLTVYDINGKVVRELVNGYKFAGKYNVEFNATGYASGIYYYRLEAGQYNNTQRMVLIK